MTKSFNEVVIVFPHHLFEHNELLSKDRLICIVEDERFFTDFVFHKQKLIFHRASMKAYQEAMIKRNYTVAYFDIHQSKGFFAWLRKQKIKTAHCFDLADHDLQKRITKKALAAKIALHIYDSSMFLSSTAWLKETLKDKKKLFMHSFYQKQRKRLNILMQNGKPVGGKWSFDDENREKLSKTTSVPVLYKPRKNKHVEEAIEYVEKHFAKNYGDVESFNYCTTWKAAHKALDDFLHHRLANFGKYQDAIIADESFLYHSVLSPLLNSGLLTPLYVVEKTLSYADTHKVPINSLEGFIRQIIGWREFVYGVYLVVGKKQKRSNFFSYKTSLPRSFWQGNTGVLPIDTTIKKVLKYAYAHHIERLMILGNFMFLCGYKPDSVYTWFMELFIDAYDWVMVPNVYGMSQYADGGLMVTKPYFSSSSYVRKMSDYKPGVWTELWDALFWFFVDKHKNLLASIPRLAIMRTAAMKKSKKQLAHYHAIVKDYLLNT